MKLLKTTAKALKWVTDACGPVAYEVADPLKGLSYTLVLTQGGAIPIASLGDKYKRALRLSEEPIEVEDARKLCQEHYEKVSSPS